MAIGDVDRHGEHRPGAVLGGANVADAVIDPDERPVGTDVAFLYLIGSRGFDETVKLLKVAGKVVRMRDVLHLEVEQFLSAAADRSEEHTSELQSLMRISYAVFCLNKKNITETKQY